MPPIPPKWGHNQNLKPAVVCRASCVVHRAECTTYHISFYICLYLNFQTMKKTLSLICLALVLINFPLKLSGQQHVFTRQDTLRGSITPERAWWDLTYYHLDIVVNPADSTVKGSNTVSYRVLREAGIMQIDLQEPMQHSQCSSKWKKP